MPVSNLAAPGVAALVLAAAQGDVAKARRLLERLGPVPFPKTSAEALTQIEEVLAADESAG